ncbi:MAG: hypothetical protein K8H74_11325 [Notoacmeibacter sp.]|nr:hypothetical protein [Notoacmeibacter sp.]
MAIGTFCAFITPIWQQNDALILGRCDFRFGDYWKQGLPLEVLVVFSRASGARVRTSHLSSVSIASGPPRLRAALDTCPIAGFV